MVWDILGLSMYAYCTRVLLKLMHLTNPSRSSMVTFLIGPDAHVGIRNHPSDRVNADTSHHV
jgi:hypothetical protein